MSKAKMPDKRAAGDVKSKAKGKGKGKDGKLRKAKGPKSHLEPNKRKVDDEMIQGAEEMLDEGSGDDSDEDQQILEAKIDRAERRKTSQAGKGADFLLHLDERSVSKTNAEVQRLRRQEIIRLKEEERQAGISKGRKKGKARAQDVQLSEEESTDMEGASLPSEGDEDEIAFLTDDDDHSEGAAKELIDSDRELDHLGHLEKRKKRKELEDEREMLQRKKKKLPTRGAEGWSSGEDIDEDESKQDMYGEDEDNDDDEMNYLAAGTAIVGNKKDISSRVVHDPLPAPSIEETYQKQKMTKPKSTIVTGTRFGLQSPFDILSIRQKSERVTLAREQIARLSTDIINDPEVSLGFIKRLSVFAGTSVESAEDRSKKAVVDDSIRASAILSMCAVFVDVLPGYRIRDLTEAEAKEKVNQELARRREWEQGLVKVYRDYLELCERVTRDRTDLSRVSLKAMCTLVTKATQFNFRTNLLRSLVSYLSRRSWNQGSEDANNALIEVLKSDIHGEVSLEIVRLLNRMIKEKKFNVNERVLEMLCHLRLKNELQADRRADMTTISRATDAFDKSLKPKDVRKGKGQHLSKAAVKKMREVREIQKELKEADAEVDQEERERHQSETLKLLFVLYFSILKAPVISNGLYVAALQGLVIFAHRINVDFFRDLLDVLRKRIKISLASIEDDEEDDELEEGDDFTTSNTLTALHCIVTSFELLSGQGEALNIDLSDMVNHLFGLLLSLCMNPDLENNSTASSSKSSSSPSALILRAIQLCLVSSPIYSLPTERLAAFVIRMLVCCLHTPAKTALGLLQLTRILMSKKEELKGLLDNSDRAKNGTFDSSSDMLDGLRPLQSGYIPWQLQIIRSSCHEEIREQCDKILAL